MFDTSRPAARRYGQRVLLAALAYAGLLIGAEYAVRLAAPGVAIRFVLALLPALAIVAIFVALGRFLVEETDEYLRVRMVRQILWATGATLSLATVYGFLQVFDVAPAAPLYVIAILWFFCLGGAGAALRVRGS